MLKAYYAFGLLGESPALRGGVANAPDKGTP